jgi:hypothetical protein
MKSPHKELYESAVDMEVGLQLRGALPKYGRFLKAVGALTEDLYKALKDGQEVTGNKLCAIVNRHQPSISGSCLNLKRAFEDLADIGFKGSIK